MPIHNANRYKPRNRQRQYKPHWVVRRSILNPPLSHHALYQGVKDLRTDPTDALQTLHAHPNTEQKQWRTLHLSHVAARLRAYERKAP